MRTTRLPVLALFVTACSGGAPLPDGGTKCEEMPDAPDDAFMDSNCDGVDGVLDDALFVSTSGVDTNQGTRDQPVRTIQVGLTRAVSRGKRALFVSEGTYDGPVLLVNGVSIYGGYSQSAQWERGASFKTRIVSTTELSGRIVAVEGRNITSPTVIDHVEVEAGDAMGAGASSIALYCSGCTSLTVKSSALVAGLGAAGMPGGAGVSGADGGTGIQGSPGTCDNNQVGAAGGAGGFSICGRTGGIGGTGGDYGVNPGQVGGTGTGGTMGGTPGAGGDPGRAGGPGNPGTDGPPGMNGGAGMGGAVTAGYWVGAAGMAGTNGTPGNGGGGGGGGGGQGCTICNNGPGNGAGGGGAGGCSGTAGMGGQPGGGSFGAFFVASNGAAIVSTRVTSRSGGRGGAGGNGGTGGRGGGGGPGQTVCTSEIGAGGNGGRGGHAGGGGHGGGGAGGPSYAIVLSGSSATLMMNTLQAGTGGMGGDSMGNPGGSGASGEMGSL